MAADANGERRVTIDFMAIMLVGLALSMLLALNIFFTIWEHEHRSDEHDRIAQQIVQLERAERAEQHPAGGAP